MPCPQCGERTGVVDTRANLAPWNGATPYIKRRRECRAPKCRHRFTTTEKAGGSDCWGGKRK